MANEEQLAILGQGVEAWNMWRREGTAIKAEFYEPHPKPVDLRGANLSNANLQGVDFREADLSGAELRGTILRNANLRFARLNNANLLRAVLIDADLYAVDLTSAQLPDTDQREANLADATLVNANLEGADLRGANLGGTNFGNAILVCANLVGVVLQGTLFVDVDLSEVKGLDEALHFGPSTLGVNTLYRSKGNISEVFLRGAGVPEDMIAYSRSLRGKVIDFYSCFISHSAKDKLFCERLYADLQAKGVRVWYFPEDAKWGETVWVEIDRSIKVYDKLIVVCSDSSLQSGPVNREIERALTREDKEGKGILFPIRIDDYIFDKWDNERKADVLRKVVGDFSGWDKDAAKYDKAFDKLLKGLQAESEKA
ncbi:Secreted effector protein PipB2 [Anaerolineae bacterium]|nr:Secreted effector protein PipB2 [Anaerolineae bacterium]